MSTASSTSAFNTLCTGVCERELVVLNHTHHHPMINEGDLLIALRCSSGTVNSQGYVQLKELFQKKNIHLNDTVPFRTVDGDEESFFSLLLQKSSILAATLVKTIGELVKSRTIKAVRYLKGEDPKRGSSRSSFVDVDVGLARMIESLLGSSSSNLSAELNGQQWPVMPPLFTWIYQHVRRMEERWLIGPFSLSRVVSVRMKCSNTSIAVLIICWSLITPRQPWTMFFVNSRKHMHPAFSWELSFRTVGTDWISSSSRSNSCF